MNLGNKIRQLYIVAMLVAVCRVQYVQDINHKFNCADENVECIRGQNEAQCVEGHNVCDGIKDCTNGMDESEATCQGEKCGVFYFWCKDNPLNNGRLRCIHQSKWCNGVANCSKPNDEDQQTCKTYLCHLGFKCGNNVCLPRSKRCDGEIDCSDTSDENECEDYECQSGYAKCNSNECILSKYWCDRRNHCRDQSDERYCMANEIDPGLTESRCSVQQSTSLLLMVPGVIGAGVWMVQF